MHELERASSKLSRQPYLNNGRGIRFLFLYHSTHDSREIIGLFSPDTSAKVISIDGARTRQPIAHLPRFYSERFARLPADHRKQGVFEYSADLEFAVSYHGTAQAGYRALNRELATFAAQRTQPTVLVVFSPRSQPELELRAPAISDFPVIALPSGRESGSALMWLNHTTRRMIVAYLSMSARLKEHLEMARHYDVPAGNIEGDAPLFLADIDFARRLAAQDMVLWWAPAARPDLGGIEDDANTPQAIDELGSPEFSNAGCYTNVTFRIALQDLAIDALLQSALVNELEGSGSGALAFDSASHTLDDYSKGAAHNSLTLGDAVLSTQTFAILKSMVKGWYLDKARIAGTNPVADLLVDNFWRWISSSAAGMFDPGIHRFLHGLMKKTFIQLLAEFRRLGSTVVYADFNEIILLTSKPSTANTVAYAKYLLTAANANELFRHLSFEIVNFWETLVWMDVQNHGGIPVLPEDCASARTQSPPARSRLLTPRRSAPTLAAEDVVVGRHVIDLEWNVRSFLPPAIQHDFEVVISSFIDQMFRSKRQAVEQEREPLRAIQLTQSTGPALDPVKEKEVGLARKVIGRKLTRKLLALVQDILANQKLAPTHPEIAETLLFPILPGSHLRPTNPALEFVKTVCHVLGLARDLSVEVQVLKRNLLDLIGVREFADTAVFRNPCDVLRLPSVICTQCQSSRDLDLCRDPERLPQLVEIQADDGSIRRQLVPPRNASWLCPTGHLLDTQGIEIRLIEYVQRLVLQYQLQDVRLSRLSSIPRGLQLTHHSLSVAPAHVPEVQAGPRRQPDGDLLLRLGLRVDRRQGRPLEEACTYRLGRRLSRPPAARRVCVSHEAFCSGSLPFLSH